MGIYLPVAFLLKIKKIVVFGKILNFDYKFYFVDCYQSGCDTPYSLLTVLFRWEQFAHGEARIAHSQWWNRC